MAGSRRAFAGLGLVALLAIAGTAAAHTLTIPAATEKAARFAERTCDHDPHCVGSGVLNCRRQSERIVLCRIFDDRETRVQGTYRCHRLVRMGMDRVTHRRSVTGLGRWHC